MHKKKVAVESIHNSLPSRNKPAEPKTGLSTFFGIGTEEIRKSIEALDRMLDQYDGGPESPSSGNSSGEKKFAPPKVDPAAHMLASCMKAAGGHKLRKSIVCPSAQEDDLPLPPPPPELLLRNASWAGPLPMNQLPNVEYASPKCRAAPTVPKRDPETKLSSSSSSDSTAFGSQFPREDGFDAGGIPFSGYTPKRHPESGYITPDQETIDSIFLGCQERFSGLRMSHPEVHQYPLMSMDYRSGGDMDRLRRAGADLVFPLPPAEFGDCVPSQQVESPPDVFFLRNSAVCASNVSLQLGHSGDYVQSMGSYHPLQQSFPAALDTRPGSRSLGRAMGTHLAQQLGPGVSAAGVSLVENGPLGPSTISPYLACVVPPPPPIGSLGDVDRFRCSHPFAATFDIVPPPPPMQDVLPPGQPPPPLAPLPPSSFPQEMQFSNSGDLPSPTRLPPPPTLPKLVKKTTAPFPDPPEPSSPSALPFKVNLKPVEVNLKPVGSPKTPSKPAMETDGAAPIYAVPCRLDSKHSSPSASGAIRGDSFREPVHHSPTLETTLFSPLPHPLPKPAPHLPPQAIFQPTLPPPPPPPPPPGPLPLSISSSSLSSCLLFTSRPPPVVPSKSWTPVPPPPPPFPGYEGNSRLVEESKGSPASSGLASHLLRSAELRSAAASNEKSNPSPSSPPGSRAALISQIQTGIQLRKSANGAKIRQTSSNPGGAAVSSADEVDTTRRRIGEDALGFSCGGGGIAPGGDEFTDVGNLRSTKTSGSSSPPLSSDSSLSRDMFQQGPNEVPVDITKLPGYQEIPPNCPTWKRALIEKKNKQLEEDAVREMLTKKQEEERWRDIPEWKRSLIIEKEKKKLEELAPYQAERKRQEGEMERLQSLPEWKRNLIVKKRGDNA